MPSNHLHCEPVVMLTQHFIILSIKYTGSLIHVVQYQVNCFKKKFLKLWTLHMFSPQERCVAERIKHFPPFPYVCPSKNYLFLFFRLWKLKWSIDMRKQLEKTKAIVLKEVSFISDTYFRMRSYKLSYMPCDWWSSKYECLCHKELHLHHR